MSWSHDKALGNPPGGGGGEVEREGISAKQKQGAPGDMGFVDVLWSLVYKA